jgi:hypothetical protein
MERPTKYNLASEDYYIQFCDSLKILYEYALITNLTNTKLQIVLVLFELTDGCVH